MIVVEKIMMQRRDPNGLQKEYHKSDRIATAMCDAAGSDAEYAGMAVRRADARVKAKNAVPLALISTALIPRGISASYTRIACRSYPAQAG